MPLYTHFSIFPVIWFLNVHKSNENVWVIVVGFHWDDIDTHTQLKRFSLSARGERKGNVSLFLGQAGISMGKSFATGAQLNRDFCKSSYHALKIVSLCLGVVWGSLGRICSLLDKTASCLRFGSALLIKKQHEVVTVIAHRLQNHTEEFLRQETCSLDKTSWACRVHCLGPEGGPRPSNSDLVPPRLGSGSSNASDLEAPNSLSKPGHLPSEYLIC